MTNPAPMPGLLRRIPLAIATFFSIIASGEFAARIQNLNLAPAQPQPAPQPAPAAPPAPAPAPVFREATPDAALQLLGLLQRDARLIDFTQEDLGGYTDADIGAAARVVHAGCRKVIREHAPIEPVRAESEGASVTIEAGFEPSKIKLTGDIKGSAPYRGTLRHRGWRVRELKLPTLIAEGDTKVLAAAEVELS